MLTFIKDFMALASLTAFCAVAMLYLDLLTYAG